MKERDADRHPGPWRVMGVELGVRRIAGCRWLPGDGLRQYAPGSRLCGWSHRDGVIVALVLRSLRRRSDERQG